MPRGPRALKSYSYADFWRINGKRNVRMGYYHRSGPPELER
ncbi:MAG TPA: hypothetical protein VM163_01280 [bacterium]|nr:hypothetical protein [bacterium]